jgi:hypothetical protein
MTRKDLGLGTWGLRLGAWGLEPESASASAPETVSNPCTTAMFG